MFLEGFNKAHVTSHLVSRAPIAHGKYSMGLFFKQNRLCEAHIMCYKHSTPCEASNVFSKYSIQSLKKCWTIPQVQSDGKKCSP